MVEVPADRGRGQRQPLREDGRRAGAELEQRLGHALSRGGVDGLVDFHNIIVSLLLGRFN